MSDKVQIHVCVSKRTRQRLKLMADEDGTSLMALAEALLERALTLEEMKRSDGLSLGDRAKVRHWQSVRAGAPNIKTGAPRPDWATGWK